MQTPEGASKIDQAPWIATECSWLLPLVIARRHGNGKIHLFPQPTRQRHRPPLPIFVAARQRTLRQPVRWSMPCVSSICPPFVPLDISTQSACCVITIYGKEDEIWVGTRRSGRLRQHQGGFGTTRMQNESSGSQIIRFGTFELDVRAGELRKRGAKIRLQEQPLRILEMLLAHPGQLVTREELRSRLWPSDTFVDFDHGLNKAINKLREALGDSAESPRFVETIPRRGYRMIATPGKASGRVESLVVLPLEDLARSHAGILRRWADRGVGRRPRSIDCSIAICKFKRRRCERILRRRPCGGTAERVV